ncbi:FimB/Mfa2 family fimbrial subunit [Bacteroides sp. OttesenSCG-928-M17]|nr:FimB/Mfa2 family fimbrial subunit [Bacteroides sp. OttesenSCG-928-M17]MDL2291757.1 FimB/Mfa2 family fimbrial subunit [Bacteroides sp. OttesenSCG-928-F21]
MKRLIHQTVLAILTAAWVMTSCTNLNEDLPECRLYVKFKYDYNLLSADAFHTQVDKVDLYVFDKEGKFLFKQSEEGAPLATGNYRMEVSVPVGQYKMMAWAGMRDSYDITDLQPGVSTIEEVKLKLKRDQSLVINKEFEPLWYGEILDVNFTYTHFQTETINLIKDTNKIRFVFQNQSANATLDVNNYTYELTEANGYLDYDNTLLADEVLNYQPYHIEQSSATTGVIELNTMRLMTDRSNHFEVKDKTTGTTVFKVDLTDFFLQLRLEEYKAKWGDQEYLDRKDSYEVVFFLGSSSSNNPWLSVAVIINGWTWYIQREDAGGGL